MDEVLNARLDAQDEKLDQIYRSVEKTRKYFLWTLVATVVAFVLPLVAAMILLPFTLGPLMTSYGL